MRGQPTPRTYEDTFQKPSHQEFAIFDAQQRWEGLIFRPVEPSFVFCFFVFCFFVFPQIPKILKEKNVNLHSTCYLRGEKERKREKKREKN